MFLEARMSSGEFRPTARLTLAEQVHHALLDAIKGGELEPGQRLHDHTWAKRWDISRTPVREAFQYLTREGLVEAEAARYTKLADFTPENAAQEAREWAMVHASLADALTKQAVDLLVHQLRRAHDRYGHAPAHERPAVWFDFFGLLRDATPSFGLRFGSSVAAYRYRLATFRLPERRRADLDLQAAVIDALDRSEPDAYRSAFKSWLPSSPARDAVPQD
jgi:DNA-binding GntR family transcriptional regulator